MLTRRNKAELLRSFRRIQRSMPVDWDQKNPRSGTQRMFNRLRQAKTYPEDWGTPQNADWRFLSLSEASVG